VAGRVIVVGSANVDLVWQGDRLPERGETVTDGRFVTALGGKGANQAAAAAALGASVRFVGCVGDDAHGALVRVDLAARDIDCRALATVDAATGVALIMVGEAGENVIAVAPGANRALPPPAVAGIVETGDVLLCSCEIPLDTVRAAVAHANDVGATAIVNPAPARQAFAAALLTPNERECAQLGGIETLLGLTSNVVVTRGAAGATIHRRAQGPVDVPGFPMDAVDTTGAGDAFNGALAWALTSGRALEEAVRLACAAGALATRAIGARASLPTADEVYALATA
jgi:ribokinase